MAEEQGSSARNGRRCGGCGSGVDMGNGTTLCLDIEEDSGLVDCFGTGPQI